MDAIPNPKRPTIRTDTDTTQVGDDYHPEDRDSTRRVPRFNSDQASLADNPYNPAPSRPRRLSKLHSPFPPAKAKLREQIDEKLRPSGDTWPHDDIPKNAEGWQKCTELAEQYDKVMCNAWKDEVDKLLIFAGLFSGVVTAFTTQSYLWLHEQPVNSSARLLSFIAMQLANTTNPVQQSPAVPEFTVTRAQIRINVVWFLSLTLSLTTVLIGILCLQWLREFQRVAGLPHKDAIALRQMRYEGLIKWHVPRILSTLPLLLQLSLILFFIGLLDLLWSLNTLVAACVSAVAFVVMLFLMITTALPALQHALTKDENLRIVQCPYKSPQSWLFYRSGQLLFWLIARSWSIFDFDSTRCDRLLHSLGDTNWLTYDMRWRRLRDAKSVSWGVPSTFRDSDDVVNGLQWINKTFSGSSEAVFSVYHSLAELNIPAATATIFSFYPELGLVDSITLRTMMEQPSRTETQKRDVIAAYYLKLHQGLHPALKTAYVEAVIRILDTKNVPRPFYRWLSHILQDLLSRQQQPLIALLPSESMKAVTQLNTEKVTIQILLCVKSLIARDLLPTIGAVAMAWALFHGLLTPSPPPPPNHRHSTHSVKLETPNRGSSVNIDHFKLAIAFFEELSEWLLRGKEMRGWDLRVKLCTEGMIRLFPSSIDTAALKAECPMEMRKAAELVRALNVHLSELGGAAVVLGRERKIWWHRFFKEEPCEVKEWDFLVGGFEKVEGG